MTEESDRSDEDDVVGLLLNAKRALDTAASFWGVQSFYFVVLPDDLQRLRTPELLGLVHHVQQLHRELVELLPHDLDNPGARIARRSG